ncbi:MAG: hypothetical protein ABJN87_00425, partial [Gilvibacter sp.]
MANPEYRGTYLLAVDGAECLYKSWKVQWTFQNEGPDGAMANPEYRGTYLLSVDESRRVLVKMKTPVLRTVGFFVSQKCWSKLGYRRTYLLSV